MNVVNFSRCLQFQTEIMSNWFEILSSLIPTELQIMANMNITTFILILLTYIIERSK